MSGWGFKIDYARAIAEDRAQVALYDSPLLKAICASLTEEERGWIADHYHYDVVTWVTAYPEKCEERATITGTALEEFECGTLVLEIRMRAADSKPEPKNWYARGRAVCKAFEHVGAIVTEEERVKLLRKAKSALARHLRNQVLHA